MSIFGTENLQESLALYIQTMRFDKTRYQTRSYVYEQWRLSIPKIIDVVPFPYLLELFENVTGL